MSIFRVDSVLKRRKDSERSYRILFRYFVHNYATVAKNVSKQVTSFSETKNLFSLFFSERKKSKIIDEAMASIKGNLKGKGNSSSGRGSSGRGSGRAATKSSGNRSANTSSSRSGLRSTKDVSEDEEEASDDDSENETASKTRTTAGRRSGAGQRPGVVTLKRGAPTRKTKKYESDEEFVPDTRSGKQVFGLNFHTMTVLSITAMIFVFGQRPQ